MNEQKDRMSVLEFIVQLVGDIALGVILAVFMVWGFGKVDRWINHPTLQSGIVAGFSYHDGTPWYSEWVFGKYSFRVEHGDGQPHDYLVVEDEKGHQDFWEVSADQLQNVDLGQHVTRNQFR